MVFIRPDHKAFFLGGDVRGGGWLISHLPRNEPNQFTASSARSSGYVHFRPLEPVGSCDVFFFPCVFLLSFEELWRLCLVMSKMGGNGGNDHVSY